MKESRIKRIGIINIVAMVVSLLLFGFGAFLMFVNEGIIQLKTPTPPDEELVYHGKYVNLLSYKQEPASFSNDEVYVAKTDVETGLPAVASLTQVGMWGKEIVRVNTVTFNYQGRPAALSFTNDVADKFCYLDTTFSADNVWETDSDTLKSVLADYSAQASKLF